MTTYIPEFINNFSVSDILNALYRKIDANGQIIVLPAASDFPAAGKNNCLYIAEDKKTAYFWSDEDNEYKSIKAGSGNTPLRVDGKSFNYSKYRITFKGDISDNIFAIRKDLFNQIQISKVNGIYNSDTDATVFLINDTNPNDHVNKDQFVTLFFDNNVLTSEFDTTLFDLISYCIVDITDEVYKANKIGYRTITNFQNWVSNPPNILPRNYIINFPDRAINMQPINGGIRSNWLFGNDEPENIQLLSNDDYFLATNDPYNSLVGRFAYGASFINMPNVYLGFFSNDGYNVSFGIFIHDNSTYINAYEFYNHNDLWNRKNWSTNDTLNLHFNYIWNVDMLISDDIYSLFTISKPKDIEDLEDVNNRIPVLVNNLIQGGNDFSLSAEQGKILYNMIIDLQNKVDLIEG